MDRIEAFPLNGFESGLDQKPWTSQGQNSSPSVTKKQVLKQRQLLMS
jgi:hypothetical protein